MEIKSNQTALVNVFRTKIIDNNIAFVLYIFDKPFIRFIFSIRHNFNNNR